MVYIKMNKGPPPLRIPELSKKSQDNQDEIKKLYKANKLWNNLKFQFD